MWCCIDDKEFIIYSNHKSYTSIRCVIWNGFTKVPNLEFAIRHFVITFYIYYLYTMSKMILFSSFYTRISNLRKKTQLYFNMIQTLKTIAFFYSNKTNLAKLSAGDRTFTSCQDSFTFRIGVFVCKLK